MKLGILLDFEKFTGRWLIIQNAGLGLNWKKNEIGVCITSHNSDFKCPWPLTPRSYQWTETYVVIYTPQAISVPHMNTLCQKLKEGVRFQAILQISKVMMVIWKLSCNLHNVSNHCAKYEYPPSKKEEEFAFWSEKTGFKHIWHWSKFDFKVIRVIWDFHYNIHTIGNHCA